MFLRDAPWEIEKAGIDALLVDQMEAAGASVADLLNLPYITVCNALMLNKEVGVPPPFTGFSFSRSLLARLRNWTGYVLGRRAVHPITSVTNRYRLRWGLKPYLDADDSFSSRAQISQQPKAFDFPRTALPQCFHYVGPFRDSTPSRSEFPWHKLNSDRLAYVSLGSMQGSKFELFRMFATALSDLRIQAVLSHGGALSDDMAASLPGSHVVVSHAPQHELIGRCKITLTHAGLNTVLDSLSHGTPLVAIPITYEQPAIAQRIRWTGAGFTLSLRSVSVKTLRNAIDKVLESSAYTVAARAVQSSIREAGGTPRAADLIEAVLSK